MANWVCSVLFLLSGCAYLAAQIVSGTILGRTTDESRAGVPKATITLTNPSTGLERTAVSDDTGNFAFPQLPPGTYMLSATATGFKTYRVSGINLPVHQTVRADIQFEVGQITQNIVVKASAEQVQTETSELGQVITTSQIVELPLNGGTSYSWRIFPRVLRRPTQRGARQLPIRAAAQIWQCIFPADGETRIAI